MIAWIEGDEVTGPRFCLLLGAAILAACQQGAGSKGIGRGEAVAIADALVARIDPKLPLDTVRPAVYERKRSWYLAYRLPEDSMGGAPTIEIDKRSGEIIFFFNEQ